MLVMDQKKIPIKKRDINKQVLKECSRSFSTFFAASIRETFPSLWLPSS